MSEDSAEHLLSLFKSLSTSDQAVVIAFAEFLRSRSGELSFSQTAMAPVEVPEPEPIPDPELIPRPDDEKVVAAVKRLSKTYFMLDKRSMLSATSDLVTSHIMKRRDAAEVIDDLEQVFREQYEQLKQDEI